MALGDPRQRLDVRAQVLRAQRAVEPDRQRPAVRDRGVKGLGRLAGQRASGSVGDGAGDHHRQRSEEHTSELQSLMRNSYAVFCLKKNKDTNKLHKYQNSNVYHSTLLETRQRAST